MGLGRDATFEGPFESDLVSYEQIRAFLSPVGAVVPEATQPDF
jgi:hypothetical protein